MVEESRNKQIEALARVLGDRTTKIPDKVTLATLKGWIKEDNGKRGATVASSVPTLSRNFREVDSTTSSDAAVRVLCEIRNYLVARKGFAPVALVRYIERQTESEQLGGHSTEWSAHTPVTRLQQIARDAEAHGNTEIAARALEEIAMQMSRQASGGRQKVLEQALDCASRGHALVMEVPEPSRSASLTQLEGKCARTAAWISVQLFRRAVRSTAGAALLTDRLVVVKEWKEREASAEDRLGRPVAAALARFHRDRAESLAADNPHSEIEALKSVSDALIQAKSTDGEWSALAGDLWYHDLNLIITRLCAVDWAYSDHERLGYTMRNNFQNGVHEIVSDLMTIYADDDIGVHSKSAVQALLDIRTHVEAIEKVYNADELPDMDELDRLVHQVDVTDFLHAAEAMMLTAMGLARYAIAVFDLTRAGRAPRIRIDSLTLLLTARDHCRRVTLGTHDRTFGSIIRVRIDGYMAEIEQRLPIAEQLPAAARVEDQSRIRSEDEVRPYADAAADLMGELAFLTLVSARSEDDDRLEYARTEIARLASSIGRFIGEMVDLSMEQRTP